MNLKPILIVAYPERLQLPGKTLGEIQAIFRKFYPQFWTLVIISDETEEMYMELFTWKSTTYLNYASLLQIIDPNQYEKLERYRQYTIMGDWETDLSEYDKEDEE